MDISNLREFQCSRCGAEILSPVPDEKAEKELLEKYGFTEAPPNYELVVLCDDCYKAMNRSENN